MYTYSVVRDHAFGLFTYKPYISTITIVAAPENSSMQIANLKSVQVHSTFGPPRRSAESLKISKNNTVPRIFLYTASHVPAVSST